MSRERAVAPGAGVNAAASPGRSPARTWVPTRLSRTENEAKVKPQNTSEEASLQWCLMGSLRVTETAP